MSDSNHQAYTGSQSFRARVIAIILSTLSANHLEHVQSTGSYVDLMDGLRGYRQRLRTVLNIENNTIDICRLDENCGRKKTMKPLLDTRSSSL